MYDVGSKPLNSIRSIFVNSLTCVRVKRDKSECFRICSGVRQEYILAKKSEKLFFNSLSIF